MRAAGFSLVELLVGAAIAVVLSAVLAGAGWEVYRNSSLAVSANNLRQLGAGSAAYLAENQHRFWRYRRDVAGGTEFWFGFETLDSLSRPEGQRVFDPAGGPLGPYVPAGIRPDPSFGLGVAAFKPKYQAGYLGVGYNVLLGAGWVTGSTPGASYWALTNPARTVVFFTSAQVNTFQPPASARNPMIEEFYGIDQREVTAHFRHRGKAMVVFADGNAGFLAMDESTRDPRMPKANIGRFAPRNSRLYLE